MLKWFRRPGAPKSGPDYRHVDSREKAERMAHQGELTKLLLLPVEFGGTDILPNVVYVPPFAAELKIRLDQNTVMTLARQGKVRRYTATPQFDGTSVVPVAIKVSATDPGRFEGTIAIWGSAVQPKDSAPVPATSAPDTYAPSIAPLENLGAEDFVRVFIADYERWNRFAFELSRRKSAESRKKIEVSYGALIEKYCPPGQNHQPIAYGSEASHDTERETIIGTDLQADKCIVKTQHTKQVGTVTLIHDYEYSLMKLGQPRWFLTSVLYVSNNDKFEGL